MPYCFEAKHPVTGQIMFVEVVNTCTHHFTGEKMRFVRIHTVHDGRAICSYTFMEEAEWKAALDNRISHTGDEQA